MHHSSSTPVNCPEHSLLLALVEGRLPDQEADTVSLHVADCNNCDARMEQIEEDSDPLVHALSSFPATDDDELMFQRLQAELLSQPEPFTGTSGITTSSSPEDFPEDTSYSLQQALPFQLGNYELLEQIGAGAHGAVFRARHRRLEREVAIKLLLRARGPFVEEFLNEMRVVGKLDHPNIIRATDAGEHDGIYFLVMEFVPGLDVSSLLLRTGPLRVADACEIIRQTALGLAFAHQHKLVHRDVKTSNLLFSSNGNVKLLDLGLATIPSQSSQSDSSQDSSSNDSANGTSGGKQFLSGPRGTADYMAPEQWKEASTVTHKADLYSLGCTFFKLLAGQPPFRELPVTGKQLAHESVEVPALSNFRDDVPAAVEQLVLRLLSKSPDARPESALQVADELSTHAISARLTRIARLHCPEIKFVPTTSSTLPLRDSIWRRIGRFPSKISRRTQIIGTLSLVAATAFFLATRPDESGGQLKVSSWRTLSPSAPAIVKLKSSDRKPQLEMDGSQFRFESTGVTMVHLGNPMVKPFRWRTRIERLPTGTDEIVQYGIFFRLRKNKRDEFGFQTIEFIRGGGITRVLWSAYQEPDQMSEPVVLAETVTDIPADAAFDLEVVLARTGFPEISINGKSSLESEWVLSAEARDIVASNRDELARVFAGRIGVFHMSGRTKVHSSQLSYLDR